MTPLRSSRIALFTLVLPLTPLSATPLQGQTPAPRPLVAPAPATVPSADDPTRDPTVVATVNQGKISRGEVLKLLTQYSIPAGRDEEVYQAAVDAMVNRKLLEQFLDQRKVVLAESDIDAEIEKVRQQLKESNRGDLNGLLADMNLTPAEFRQQLSLGLRWTKFLDGQATDQALRDYFERNKDLFAGTQVKASHILLKLEPDASEGDKESARARLADLKKQITEGKISFAEAANTHSEDDGNRETPDGGNLDYFNRRGQYIDAFCDAAFALNVGEISDPVETEYGMHLIQVTDRIKGQDVTYEQVKDQIKQIYGNELQQDSIGALRKASKIAIQPMPASFFPKAPTAPATAPAAAPAPGASKGQGQAPNPGGR